MHEKLKPLLKCDAIHGNTIQLEHQEDIALSIVSNGKQYYCHTKNNNDKRKAPGIKRQTK